MCSPCVSTSPALPLGTQLWLTGSPSPSGLSVRLAEASKALLLKAGGWGAACTEVGMGKDALAMVGDGRGVLLVALVAGVSPTLRSQ